MKLFAVPARSLVILIFCILALPALHAQDIRLKYRPLSFREGPDTLVPAAPLIDELFSGNREFYLGMMGKDSFYMMVKHQMIGVGTDIRNILQTAYSRSDAGIRKYSDYNQNVYPGDSTGLISMHTTVSGDKTEKSINYELSARFFGEPAPLLRGDSMHVRFTALRLELNGKKVKLKNRNILLPLAEGIWSQPVELGKKDGAPAELQVRYWNTALGFRWVEMKLNHNWGKSKMEFHTTLKDGEKPHGYSEITTAAGSRKVKGKTVYTYNKLKYRVTPQ